jgi:hypothetical protein
VLSVEGFDRRDIKSSVLKYSTRKVEFICARRVQSRARVILAADKNYGYRLVYYKLLLGHIYIAIERVIKVGGEVNKVII